MPSRGLRLRPEHYDSVEHLPRYLRDSARGWGGVVFPRTPRSFPIYPDWRGKDLRGQDLRGYDLTGGDFGGANLEGMDLRKTNFNGAYMKGAKLKGANLEGANLSSANLQDAELTQTDLKGAMIMASDLTNADFTGAYMPKANLGGSVLQGTQFTEAVTKGAVSDWDKQITESWDYADDMERLAKGEQRLSELEAEVKAFDVPGKRNSLAAKMTRPLVSDSKSRIADLRFRWRHLLSTDKDSDEPAKIAQRLTRTLPPKESTASRLFKRKKRSRPRSQAMGRTRSKRF